MAKVKIKYIGKHQPKEELEVDEKKAKELLKLKDYSSDFVQSIKIPDMSWTERKIQKWLKDNKIPIIYNISNETKKNKLKEIEEYLNGSF